MKSLLLAAALLLIASPVIAADCNPVPGTLMMPKTRTTMVKVNNFEEASCTAADQLGRISDLDCGTFTVRTIRSMLLPPTGYGRLTGRSIVLTDKAGQTFNLRPAGYQPDPITTCAADNNSKEVRFIDHFTDGTDGTVHVRIDNRIFWVREARPIPQI